MIYVTLRSNSSMDIYPDNKISSFEVNLLEKLQVDPEHWDVALKEIHLLNGAALLYYVPPTEELNSNS